MRRRILHTLGMVSSLLCIVAGFMWVRSRGHAEGIGVSTHVADYLLVSHLGLVQIERVVDCDPAHLAALSLPHSHRRDPIDRPLFTTFSGANPGPELFWNPYIGMGWHHGKLGFEVAGYQAANPTYNPQRFVWLNIPYWALIGVFALFPARRMFVWTQMAGRMRRGECIACGYNLRASPDRCPECGTVVLPRNFKPGLNT
jgi:hypothetical protein